MSHFAHEKKISTKQIGKVTIVNAIDLSKINENFDILVTFKAISYASRPKADPAKSVIEKFLVEYTKHRYPNDTKEWYKYGKEENARRVATAIIDLNKLMTYMNKNVCVTNDAIWGESVIEKLAGDDTYAALELDVLEEIYQRASN